MKKTTLLAAAAASGLVLAAAGPAMANHTVIDIGGNSSPGTVPFTATTPGISFDTNFGVPMLCGASGAAGTIERGATVPSNGIAAITSTTWNDCEAPTLFDTEFTVTQTSTWSLNATSAPSGGVADGNITGIVDVEVRSVDPGACDFNVSGTVDGAFDANNDELIIADPNDEYPLLISDVDGCFGEVLDEDLAQFEAVYDVDAGGDISFVPGSH